MFYGIYIIHLERFYTVVMWSRCDSNRDWVLNGNPRTRNGSIFCSFGNGVVKLEPGKRCRHWLEMWAKLSSNFHGHS